MSAIAFFDFDGTITHRDSFLRFLLFKKKITGKFIGQLIRSIPVLVSWKMGLYHNGKAKEKVFGIFFKGIEQERFDKLCSEFANNVFPLIVKDAAMKKIAWHLQRDHRVVIVSASIENYIRHFAAKHTISYIGTRIEIIDGHLTGKFIGPNCYGNEKVKRIKKIYDLNSYENIFGYGDSRGDKAMLSIAKEAFYRSF